MEGSVGTSSTEKKSYTDVFNEAFPYYLSIGMSYEHYWFGEPWLVKAYKEAHERQVEHRNYEMWLQGQYIYVAIGAMAPILNPLSKKHKPEDYLKEPLIVTERAKQRKELEKAQSTANFLIAWAEAVKEKGINNG